MKRTVRNQAPCTRCYKCGDPELASVCHHCGRAMCSEHEPESPPKLLWFLRNPEFTELGLNEKAVGTRGAHCKDCLHYLIPYIWIAFWACALLVVSVWIIHIFRLQLASHYIHIGTVNVSLFYLFVTVIAVFAFTPIVYFFLDRYRTRFKKNLLLIVAEAHQIITKDCWPFLVSHKWIVLAIGFLILSELTSPVFRSQLGKNNVGKLEILVR